MPDPDQLLSDIRSACDLTLDAMKAQGRRGPLWQAAQQLRSDVRKLDSWLSSGGNPPAAWSPQPQAWTTGRAEPRCEPEPEGVTHRLLLGDVDVACSVTDFGTHLAAGHTGDDITELERQHRHAVKAGEKP